MIEKETKRTGDMINSRKLFDDSEKTHPIQEDEMIKIEKINGTLLLIGAGDVMPPDIENLIYVVRNN